MLALVLFAIELIAVQAINTPARGCFDALNDVVERFLGLLDVPLPLLLQLLADSATGMRQPRDLLKMRRWAWVFIAAIHFSD